MRRACFCRGTFACQDQIVLPRLGVSALPSPSKKLIHRWKVAPFMKATSHFVTSTTSITSMQCRRRALHAVCRASNAYDSSRALRCAFRTATSRHDSRIPSAWEPTEWEDLNVRGQQQESTDSNGEGHNTEHEAGSMSIAKSMKAESNCDAMVGRASPANKPVKGNKSTQTKRNSPLKAYLRDIAEAQLALDSRGRVLSSDMSAERLWIPHARGQYRISAQQSEFFIGRLARLNRALHTEKQYAGQLSADEQQRLETVFDYAPRVVRPREPAVQGQVPPPPWESHGEKSRASYRRGLTYAEHELAYVIARFVDLMEPTPLERFARRAATEEVMSSINQTLRQHGHLKVTTELQGSEKTGLAMPTSDIDIRIWEQTEEGAPNEPSRSIMGRRMASYMQPIAQALRGNPERYHMVTFRHGTHPIIDFQHRPSGLDFQIVASKHSDGQEKVVEKYLSEIPDLRALYIVIRTLFDVRGLLRVHTGGIGSYGCFVMCLPPILRAKSRATRESIIAKLRLFLMFYNPYQSLDTTKYGVSCFPRQIFKKHDADPGLDVFMQYAERRGDPVRAGQWSICRRQKYQPYLLTLQDPATPHNDLGSRTHGIKHILATIVHMRSEMQRWRKRAYVDEKQPYKPFLETLVGRPDLLYFKERQKLAEYGRAVRDGKPLSASTRDAVVRAPDSELQRDNVDSDTPVSAGSREAGLAATGRDKHKGQPYRVPVIRTIRHGSVTSPVVRRVT